jgi:protease-4
VEHNPWGEKSVEKEGAEQGSGVAMQTKETIQQPTTESAESKSWRLLEKLVDNVNREQRRSRRWGIFFKSLTFIYLFGIAGFFLWSEKFGSIEEISKPHVAVVQVRGVISDGSEASADLLISSLRDAFEATDSLGVIVRINSPGGSPVQAGYVYDEIVRLRALYPEKKVMAVITDIGASGGYYLASAADAIYADKASLVGSIGVISSGFGFVDLMEKLGIERRALTAGDSKALLDPFQPLSDQQKRFWQSVLDTTHQQFIEAVKQGRGDRLTDNSELFSGLIWTGEQAVELGLIDGLGSASSVAREQFNTDHLIDYSYRPNAVERLAERLGVGVASEVMNSLGVTGAAQLK